MLLLLALAFYFAPNIWLSLPVFVALTAALALDMSLAPALVLVLLPFYMRPKHLGPIGFSLHRYARLPGGRLEGTRLGSFAFVPCRSI